MIFFRAIRCLRRLQRYAETIGDFFVGFDHVTEALAEAVFVHLLLGVLVPQAAAVRAEFVAQDDGAVVEYAEFELEVHQQQAGVVEQLGQHVVDLEGQLLHARQLLSCTPAERHDVGFVDERVALGVVLQEQFERVRVELEALFHAQALDQAAGGVVAHDAFHRDHVELLDQALVVAQQFVELGRDTGRFELLHDEGVELVVHHAFAIQLFDALAVERRGVVAKQQDQAVGVVGLVHRLGFTAVEFFTFFHDGLRFE